MRGHIDDNLWIIALTSKCTQENLAWCLLIMASLWLAMTLLYWSHLGGPAWGNHYYSTSTKLTTSPQPNPIIIPGPKGWPLIGSITLMASLAHRRIEAAATECKARRLMAFSLGDTHAIVTCDPDAAKEILNSSVFADRPHKLEISYVVNPILKLSHNNER